MVSRAAGEARFHRRCRNSPWFLLDRLQLDLFGWFLKVFGFYGDGVRNALDIQSTEIELSFAGLPRAFDGYRILHISDPHFDTLAGIEAALARRLDNIDVDLCVLTGDYMHRLDCSLDESIPPMRRMTAAISARDGIVATLGNHDSAGMAAPLEGLGIRVLVNESLAIERGGGRMTSTGFTPMRPKKSWRKRPGVSRSPLSTHRKSPMWRPGPAMPFTSAATPTAARFACPAADRYSGSSPRTGLLSRAFGDATG